MKAIPSLNLLPEASVGVGWDIRISKCLFKTSDWVPKLFWQQLPTRGRALVHCRAARGWTVQSSQVRRAGRRGWQPQGRSGRCLAAAASITGLLGLPATVTPESGPPCWYELS